MKLQPQPEEATSTEGIFGGFLIGLMNFRRKQTVGSDLEGGACLWPKGFYRIPVLNDT